jgi:hypothetical protein
MYKSHLARNCPGTVQGAMKLIRVEKGFELKKKFPKQTFLFS